MSEENIQLTDKEIQKNRLRYRLLWILIGVDILLVAYIIYQLVTLFVK